MSKERKEKKERKRLKDTKLGLWLSDKAPEVLDIVGELLPDSGALGIVKNLLDKTDVSPEEAAAVINAEVEFQKQVTARWEADMSSDVKIAKYIRPYTLIILMSMFALLVVADSIGALDFDVKESYVSLLEILMLTAFGAYFAGRSIEKVRR
tara:strand:+ start:1364 stop:1819 length:456 start_codon:yes stop_codon:yes gene_type:complete